MTAHLFTPVTFRNLTLRNRIGVSPMCQYSSVDGFANDWHLVHLGSRAVGGAGLVMMEATGVTPAGRITPACMGIWEDAHVEYLKRITAHLRDHGAVPAIQLAHAGRKASSALPWDGGKQLTKAQGGWETIAPSAISYMPEYTPPREMTKDDIRETVDAFVAAAERAVAAGFEVLEIHGAHGYLINEFLSPLTNRREDEYGGAEENRFRFMLDIARGLRATVSKDIVIGARLSCSDWAEGGFGIGDAVRLSAALKKEGVDFIDCSSGGLVPDQKITLGPGYQVPFAKEIRAQAEMPTCAVGMITEAHQANDIIAKGEADMVFLARAMLRDPYWPIHAAEALGAEMDVPAQYLRGWNAARTTAPKRKAG